MKAYYRLFRRQGAYYCEDTTTGKQTSLRTKDEAAARTLLHARNEAARQPGLNLQLARAYLTASDPLIATRTRRQAIDALIDTKRGATRERWHWASRDQALTLLYPRTLLETQPEHLLAALRTGPVSTNIQLRRRHNFCLDMGWLPWPLGGTHRLPGAGAPLRASEDRFGGPAAFRGTGGGPAGAAAAVGKAVSRTGHRAGTPAGRAFPAA